METKQENIIRTDYADVMQKSYIDYAMSVIISRALPDVRDGLKPVQRRTLYDMYELGIRYDRPYRKCARIVGDTMGKYHPHGDSSIYESLVVMAQEFKKGKTLVDGHGNFGSIEGDGAAAMRYTEARLEKLTQEVFLGDLDKNVVDFVPNFDETENLYIEGDNLEVLKLLQETYLGKIKMIYIDPPYNTGNDFVYNDDFSQDADDYMSNSGQTDEEGNRLVANTESNGRFHTDWLNMMYPRLKLARDLLSDDGVIFISIDDNEVENLKKVCDEIFGSVNFVATFPWRKRTAKSDVPFGVSQDYEWIVVYAKSNMFEASIEGGNRKYYETPDFPGRPWRIHDMTKQTTASERPNSFFTMINPKNGEEFPCDPNRTWRITKDTFQSYYDANEIVFPGDYDFLKISKPVARYFKDKDMAKAGDKFGRISVSTKFPDDIGMSQDGTKEIKSIFGVIPFGFPKNTKLLSYLLKIATEKEDSLILDFFSGSATTAHAVIQLNAEDGGNRKFIMVQLPEATDEKSEAYKAGYKNICEIGKERIRRAGKQLLKTRCLKIA